MFRKSDIILAAIILAVGIGASVFSAGGGAGEKVVITVDGKIFGTYELFEDRIVTIRRNGHINKVKIRDGEVSMAESDCPNQDCVHQGKISRPSQSIICLPNKVVVEIKGGKNEDYDSISR